MQARLQFCCWYVAAFLKNWCTAWVFSRIRAGLQLGVVGLIQCEGALRVKPAGRRAEARSPGAGEEESPGAATPRPRARNALVAGDTNPHRNDVHLSVPN